MLRRFSDANLNPLGVVLIVGSFVVACNILPLSVLAKTGDINTIELKTEIKEVTIYSGGLVSIYREGRLNVPRGTFRVICKDIPWEFNEKSLQVSAYGDVEATIYNVDFKKCYGDVRESVRYGKLKSKLRALKDSLSVVEGRIEAVKSREKLLSSLVAYSSDQAHKEFSAQNFKLEQWKRVIGFYEEEVFDISIKLDRLELVKENLKKRISEVEEEIQSIVNTMMRKGSKCKILQIECSAKDEGSVVFKINYNTWGAHWEPEYRVKLNNKTKEVELNYYARVSQKTSEDWKGVKLNLSTGKPGIGASPPHLEPLYISMEDRVVKKQDIVESVALKSGVFSVRGGRAGKVAVARWSSSEFSALFNVPGPVDLLSGSESKRFLITKSNLKGEYSLYSAPAVSENVFLKGKLVNTIPLPLIKGHCNVYVETTSDVGPISNFVGSSKIDNIATGEEFTLYFGVDKDIKVQREMVKREVISSREDRKRKVRYHYRITVQSFKDREVALTLEDRVPVSTIKDVKIKDVDIEPKPNKKGDNGIITWNLILTPKVKYEINLSFTIVSPMDLPITRIE